MTAISITMMLISMLTLWGGLIASVVHLRSVPEVVVDEGDE